MSLTIDLKACLVFLERSTQQQISTNLMNPQTKNNFSFLVRMSEVLTKYTWWKVLTLSALKMMKTRKQTFPRNPESA